MKNRVRDAARRFFAYAMQTTKRIIAPTARPGERFLPTAACPGFWDRIGLVLSMNLKP
jgi:hypothetical protein